MSKAVLISIQPKWCELIASGKKTVEVRKTKPKLETPFKCYIYETKDSKYKDIGVAGHRSDGTPYIFVNSIGKVIGEFVCDSIDDFSVPYPAYFSEVDSKTEAIIKSACLTPMDIHAYNGVHQTFGWRISDLVIYDKPRELQDFTRIVVKWWLTRERVTRPPQSWCYVEEVSNERAN